jgi:CheY-like chemotaxis protein
MVGNTMPQQNLQSPHELTPRDDAKKVVSEVLKRVDQLIRKGDLDHAQVEILRAKELDPRNVYAHALEERIFNLKSEVKNLENAQRNDELLQPQRHGKNSKPEVKTSSNPIVHKSITTSMNSQTPIGTTPAVGPLSSSIALATKLEDPLQERILDRSIELESYRKTLAEFWCDGFLTADEKRQLDELRMLLEITETEHEGIEKNVKRECYRNAIIQQLSNNPTKLSNTNSLADFRRAFQISEEEHLQIQAQLMSVMQNKERDKILVIDDDRRLLELLRESLENNGFDVTALSTSDEAYALLRKYIPDIILCDINLETSTMGGFRFYEKVQELTNVQNTPFVFLTGLTDEILVRTGKELGVDDYLMKPISEQLLISALRGKIKRFKHLKKIIEAPIHTLVA